MSDDALLRAVTTHGPHDGPPIDSMVSAPLDDDRFEVLVRAVISSRVVGQLLDAVLTGVLPTADRQAAAVALHHTDWCLSMLGLERELLRVIELLDAHGLEAVVLERTAVAHRYYEDPPHRMFGDNDILLRGCQFDDALDVLTGARYTRCTTPVRPDFDRRFGKGVTPHLQDGTELDVRRSLASGAFGLALDLDELWATTSTFELGGRELRALRHDASLIHEFFPGALCGTDPRLGTLRDLAQQLAAGRYDPERVIELGRRWEVTAVCKRAAILLQRHLAGDVDGPIGAAVAAYRPSSQEPRVVASYIADDRSFTVMVLAAGGRTMIRRLL